MSVDLQEDKNIKKIYRYNDSISFRECYLANEDTPLTNGDCTCFYTKDENWKTYYFCHQYGIHLHCTKHKEIELEKNINNFGSVILKCSKCNKDIEVENFEELLRNCMKLLNIPKFKNAKFIRLDDWYTPEIKKPIEVGTNYWMNVDVKTDKDNDTIIVLYVGKKDSKEKTQFFIKPEKLQLTSDHNDLDPATILSKIEVTLRDRTLKQEYDKREEF